MSLRPIVTVPASVLRTPCHDVEAFDDHLREIAQDMIDTAMACTAPPAVGLAAPQVGLSIRLFVYRTSPGAWLAIVNPTINSRSGKETYAEACLSIPNFSRPKPRATQIEATYFDVEGSEHILGFTGFTARIWQHEVDHLDGKLFIDRTMPKRKQVGGNGSG